MANPSKGAGPSLTNVTRNPNGTIIKKEIYPSGTVFITKYNSNRRVMTPRGTNNTTRHKKRGGYKRRRTLKK
jgi:hypothetical protein